MSGRTILISIHPRHVKNILNGVKTFEYRKAVPKEKISKIVIYSTSPTMKIEAVCSVKDIHSSTPHKIWELTNNRGGITHDFFETYFLGRSTAHAIELDDVQILEKPVSLKDLDEKLFPPQSFQYIEPKMIKKIKQIGYVNSWESEKLFS